MAQPKAQAKADLDPNLHKQIKNLQAQAAAQSTATLKGQQAPWMMPTDSIENEWHGDLFDWTEMAVPFDRSVSNQAGVDAVKDPEKPGTTGDLVVTTMQADYLAIMERSFRARHTMRRPRAVAHAMGRKAGHGNDKGPLVQCVLEFVNGLVKEGKAQAKV